MCSANMQQIYRKTPMQKCDFSNVANQFYWNHTVAWVFSYKFAGYLQKSCSDEHLWGTILQIFIQHACHIFHYKLVSNLGCFLIHSYSDLSHVNGIFCNVLLDSLFARWYLKTASCYVDFSFEKNFCNKSLFFFWYLTHRSLESPPENVLRIFL